MVHEAQAPSGHRERLIEGALECLREKGYARTTTRDVVAASGTNLGSIVYHFGTKERLLEEALSFGFRRWTEAISSAAEEAPAAPAAAMRAALDRARSAYADDPGLYSAYLEAAAESGRSEELREHMAQGYRETRARVRESVRTALGDATQADIDTLAALMVAIVDGLMLQRLYEPGAVPDGRAVIEALLRAIA